MHQLEQKSLKQMMGHHSTQNSRMLRYWLVSSLLWPFWLSSLFALTDVSVVSLDGSQRSGKLVQWGQESLTLEQAGNTASVDLRSLKNVAFSASPSDRGANATSHRIALELRDGSVLFASDLSGSQDRWSLKSAFGVGELPPATLAAVQFRSLLTAEKPAWEDWRREKGILDSLIVSRNEGVLDRVNGVILGIQPDSVEFELDGQKLNPPRTRFVGLIFARQPLERQPLAARIRLVDRSEWNATEIHWDATKEVLSWKNSLGLQCKTAVSDIVEVDLTKLNVRWLSELEAIDRKITARVTTATKFASRDRLLGPRFDGHGTSAGSDHNLIFHSPGEISFRVPDGVTNFSTRIRRISNGDVRSELHAEIYHADELVYRSVIPDDDSAKPVQVAVQSNRRLKLVIRSSSPLAAGSTVEWSQPRFER